MQTSRPPSSSSLPAPPPRSRAVGTRRRHRARSHRRRRAVHLDRRPTPRRAAAITLTGRRASGRQPGPAAGGAAVVGHGQRGHEPGSSSGATVIAFHSPGPAITRRVPFPTDTVAAEAARREGEQASTLPGRGTHNHSNRAAAWQIMATRRPARRARRAAPPGARARSPPRTPGQGRQHQQQEQCAHRIGQLEALVGERTRDERREQTRRARTRGSRRSTPLSPPRSESCVAPDVATSQSRAACRARACARGSTAPACSRCRRSRRSRRATEARRSGPSS